MPYMRLPRPAKSTVRHARRITSEFSLERPEFPLAFTCFPGLHIPNVIAFGFSFLPVFVEAKDMRLPPEVISSLDASNRSQAYR